MTDESQDFDAYHTPESVSQAERPEGWLARRPLLDKPSPPHPILSMLMDEAMCRIMLTSDGATAALKQRTTGSKPGTIAPTSSLAGEIESLGERFHASKTNRKRLELIKEAQETADRLRYAPDRSLIRGTPEWKEAIMRDPRSCRALAAIWDVSHMTIARLKKGR